MNFQNFEHNILLIFFTNTKMMFGNEINDSLFFAGGGEETSGEFRNDCGTLRESVYCYGHHCII